MLDEHRGTGVSDRQYQIAGKCGEVRDICATTGVIHHVRGDHLREQVGVVAILPCQGIHTGTTGKRVTADPTADCVVASIAEKPVAGSRTNQHITAVTTTGVFDVERRPEPSGRTCCQRDRNARCPGCPAAGATLIGQQVGAVASIDRGNGRTAVFDRQRIGPAAEQV